MIKASTDKHTLNWLRRRVNNDLLSTLSIENKSNIIYSLLAGVPAPVIVLEEGDKYSIINGSDVLCSIIQFIHGGFELQGNTEYETEIGRTLKGKTYFDFSDDEKENFLDTEVVVSITPALTECQRNILKTSLFNGITIQGQAVKVVKSSPIDSCLEELLTHKFFEAVNISSPSIDLVAQFLMISEDGVSTELRVKDIIAFKENLTEKECDIIKELDYLAKAYPEKTPYLKKTHVPMVFVVGKRALKDKLKPEKFRKIMDEFFDNMVEEYKKNCDSSSSKSKANARIRAIMGFYNSAI